MSRSSRINVWITFVGSMSLMLIPSLKVISLLVLTIYSHGDHLRFYDPDHLSFRCPISLGLHYEIWLWLAQQFLRRGSKSVDDGRTNHDDDRCLHYKLFPSASFGNMPITQWQNLILQILGWLQQFFWCLNFSKKTLWKLKNKFFCFNKIHMEILFYL